MNAGNIKFIAIILGVFFVWKVFLSDSDNYNVNVRSSITAADGLDLKNIGPLLKKAKNAEELEKLINDSSEGVNNLDLNEDNKVDYINVTEFGEKNNRGFSLTTDLGRGEVQELATIQIEKKGDEAEVEVRGNKQIYGDNHYHQSRWSGLHTYMLMSYMFRPHPFYYSPYGWGRYPGYYRSYRTVPNSSYRSRTRPTSDLSRSSTSKMANKIKSPNAGKSSTKIRAPLKNPSRSQKSFQTRNPSKTVRSGGFGRSSRGGVRRSSSSRGRSSFGGGK